MGIKEDLDNGKDDSGVTVETSMHDGISFTSASAEDVDHVVSQLEEVLENNHPAVCVMAFLAMCITLQRPHSEREEVMQGVKTISEWIAMYLSGLEVVGMDKSKYN